MYGFDEGDGSRFEDNDPDGDASWNASIGLALMMPDNAPDRPSTAGSKAARSQCVPADVDFEDEKVAAMIKQQHQVPGSRGRGRTPVDLKTGRAASAFAPDELMDAGPLSGNIRGPALCGHRVRVLYRHRRRPLSAKRDASLPPLHPDPSRPDTGIAENAWYSGTVTDFHPASGLHYVIFDDAERDWVDIEKLGGTGGGMGRAGERGSRPPTAQRLVTPTLPATPEVGEEAREVATFVGVGARVAVMWRDGVPLRLDTPAAESGVHVGNGSRGGESKRGDTAGTTGTTGTTGTATTEGASRF